MRRNVNEDVSLGSAKGTSLRTGPFSWGRTSVEFLRKLSQYLAVADGAIRK